MYVGCMALSIEPCSLRKLTDTMTYELNEVAREDDFIHPYVAKNIRGKVPRELKIRGIQIETK